MSEEEMAIEAAIAFVESFDVDGISGDVTEGTTSDQDGGDNAAVDIETSPHAISPTGRTGSKRRYKPGYSTELLHRKKREARNLRNEVRVLEEWLKRAHSNVESDGSSGRRVSVTDKHWADKAVEEFRKRRHAEKINSTLKAIHASHESIGKAILAILHRTSAIEGMEFVLALRAKAQNSLLQSNFTAVHQLEEMAAKLYLDWQAVAPKDEFSSCAYGVIVHDENVNKNAVRITSRVPVRCLPKEAGDIAWEELSNSCADGSASHYINAGKADSTFSSFYLTLESGQGIMTVEGVQLFQKFQADGRVVHVWVSELLSPTRTTAARAHAWMIFSKLANDPEYQSEIQFNARVFVETGDEISAQKLNTNHVRKTILEPWSLAIREFAFHLQETVIEKTIAWETTT